MPILTERMSVTTAGTAEQLPDVPAVKGKPIRIVGSPTNTSFVSLGRTKALAEGSTSFRLTAGNGVDLSVANANEIWLDAAVSGESVDLVTAI